MSPYLESCCLRLSANVSYQHAADDLAYLTGITVSKSAQQRLVHRQDFSQPEVVEPVEELSVDGGNIRVRTPVGEKSRWKGYKAVRLHERMAISAEFGQSPVIIEWVNAQPLAQMVTCLGDGHDGIWNLIRELAPESQRREVLDWFHLVENLHKVGGSIKRLNQAEALLWEGKVTEAKTLFEPLSAKQAYNFCEYLERHRHRIINYQYYQAEDIARLALEPLSLRLNRLTEELKSQGHNGKRRMCPKS